MNRTWTLGRLVLTTVEQAAGAPMIDACSTWAEDRSWWAGGWCCRLSPTEGRGLVVAWRGAVSPLATARLRARPLVGRLFRSRGHLV